MATELSDEIYEHNVYHDSTQMPFKHLRYLGFGSSSVVDLVESTSGLLRGRTYARKIIKRSNGPRWSEKQASIDKEVNVIKRARHIHVVCLVGTYLSPKHYAIITTPVAEENLEAYLNRADTTSRDATGQHIRDHIPQWFGCMISAIAYLHRQYIRHRDIKPENILIMGGHILLTDFGIAMDSPDDTVSATTRTRGTTLYHSPEVSRYHRCGRRADIFSLGAVFLEILTVFSGCGQLRRFRYFRRSEESRSYASNIDKVFEWINTLGNVPSSVPWYTTMLSICSRMLQAERHRRPTAEALSVCWTYQPLSIVLPASCTCNSFPDKSLKIPLQDSAGASGNYVLQIAAASGLEAIVQTLLEMGHVSVEGWRGRVALHDAAAGGHVEVVERLLTAKADVNVEPVTSQGRTALQTAAEAGHTGVVEKLLLFNADVNIRPFYDGGRTALQAAAGGGHMDIVKVLLAAKADVNARAASKDGRTALQAAAESGHMDMVKVLLTAKADVNAWAAPRDGRTALQAAAESGHMEIVKVLLAANADVNAEPAHAGGRKALQAAAERGHMDIVKVLLTAKADVNGWPAFEDGRTALQAAAGSGHMEIVKVLLAANADVNAKPAYMAGRTALQAAGRSGHTDVVKVLLAAGAKSDS